MSKLHDELKVRLNGWDWAVFVGCGAYIGVRKTLYGIANRVPGIREATDRMLVKKIERMLASYGHASHTSDATQYKPAVARPQAAE